MKFKFPLQKVLEYRKLQENLVKKDFEDAMQAFHIETRKLEEMLSLKTGAHTQAGSLSQVGGAQGPALSQIHEFLKGQEIRIQRQRQVITESEKLVEVRREILRQAVQEYKIIEKMRENKFAEYRQEYLSRDQKDMDEQSTLRFKLKE